MSISQALKPLALTKSIAVGIYEVGAKQYRRIVLVQTLAGLILLNTDFINIYRTCLGLFNRFISTVLFLNRFGISSSRLVTQSRFNPIWMLKIQLPDSRSQKLGRPGKYLISVWLARNATHTQLSTCARYFSILVSHQKMSNFCLVTKLIPPLLYFRH